MSLTTEQTAIRLGKFNASTVEALMKPKGFGQTGLSYINQKVAEIWTGEPVEFFVSKDMQWGIDNEPLALEYFNAFKCLNLQSNTTSLICQNNILTGTPDAINEAEKYGVEIKCPKTSTHVEYGSMIEGSELKTANAQYYWQIQSYMYLTGFEKWYFVSFDPRVKENKKKMFIFTIYRNDDDIQMLVDRLMQAEKIKQSILV